jgi:RNA polymerase sigma-70 factor (ECF subfamily)
MKAAGVLVNEPAAHARALPPREPFPAFYRREYPKMVAIAAAVSGSRAIAEDLAQEAMLRAHRHWDRVSTYERPGAWVRRVTINLSLSAARRASAEMRRLLRLADHSTLPEPDVADTRIWEAVAKIPGKQRAATALPGHQLTITQVSGLSRASVHSVSAMPVEWSLRA